MSDTKQQIEDMSMWLKIFEQKVFESISRLDTRIAVLEAKTHPSEIRKVAHS